MLQEGLLPHPCMDGAGGRGRVLALFVRDVLAAGVAVGELRPVAPDTVAALVTGAVEGLVESHLFGRRGLGTGRALLDEGLAELLALLRTGLETTA